MEIFLKMVSYGKKEKKKRNHQLSVVVCTMPGMWKKSNNNNSNKKCCVVNGMALNVCESVFFFVVCRFMHVYDV